MKIELEYGEELELIGPKKIFIVKIMNNGEYDYLEEEHY
jgi:hypothetical protein